MIKIAIVVGHNSRAQGANANSPLSISEYEFHNQVADRMIALLKESGISGIELERFNREYIGSYSKEIKNCYKKVDEWQARASLELHFNASSSDADYCLMLHSGSKNAQKFAQITLKHAAQALGITSDSDKKERALAPSENGYNSVQASHTAYSILTEPFFGSHTPSCEKVAELGIDGIAKMYLDSCVEFAATLGDIMPPLTDGSDDKMLVRVDLVAKDRDTNQFRDKNQFFTDNKEKLQLIVDAVNEVLSIESRSEPFTPLTLLDAVCIMNAEMGLNPDGTVDVKHTHSLGERGLLPLPSNITFWNGPESPASIDLTTLERNVKEFLMYLGNLKNKDIWVTFLGGSVYRDLFFIEGIANTEDQNNEEQQMFVLAAAVHGWFYRGMYTEDIPYTKIVTAVGNSATDQDTVISTLKEAGYKKTTEPKGIELLRNRIDNLTAGIEIHNNL